MCSLWGAWEEPPSEICRALCSLMNTQWCIIEISSRAHLYNVTSNVASVPFWTLICICSPIVQTVTLILCVIYTGEEDEEGNKSCKPAHAHTHTFSLSVSLLPHTVSGLCMYLSTHAARAPWFHQGHTACSTQLQWHVYCMAAVPGPRDHVGIGVGFVHTLKATYIWHSKCTILILLGTL